MIKSASYDKNILNIYSSAGEKTVRFSKAIAEILKFEDFLIVRTVHDPGEGARNIHRISEGGEKVWTVEMPEGVKNQANAFTGMELRGSEFRAATWQGTTHQIDLKTGKILSSLFTK